MYKMSGFRTGHSVKVNSNGEPEMDLVKVGGTALALGQTTKSASLPITVASDDVLVVKNESGDPMDIDMIKFAGTSLTIGSQVKADSIPVALPSDQVVVVDLDKLNGTDLSIGQQLKAASIPVVLASDQGALSVSFSATSNSGSRGNLESNQSVALNDTSSEIDTSTARNVVIFGSGSSLTDPITVEVSADGTNWVAVDGQIYPNSSQFYARFSGVAWNNVRLKWGGTATGVYATALFNTG